MADAKSDTNRADNPFGLPDFDLGRMLQQFQLPGVDVSRLMEDQRRNMEAVREANQAVMAGWTQLAEKQAQIFRESLEQWQQALQDQGSGKRPGPEQQTELAQRAFEQALDNVREMAEITAEAQSRAYEIMRKRIEESVRAYFQGADDQPQ